MIKIVIVSGLQPINNPRAVKEAETLASHGYDVTLIGAVHSIESKLLVASLNAGHSWKHLPVVDATDRKLLSRLRYLFYRIKGRLSRLLYTTFAIQLPSQLASYVGPMYRLAAREKADLYIIHAEPALWVGQRLIMDGQKVATDIEDWYSEDLLPEDRAKRPVDLLKSLEQFLLEKSVYTSTTSRVMAQGLAQEYSVPEPSVILNSFRYSERAHIDGKILDRKNSSIPSLIWFSQTVGPGRGLELLFEALHLIDLPIEIHIRGRLRNEMFHQQLLALIPAKHLSNIYFHNLVSQSDLLSRLAEHDIGFCGELSSCKSRDLTITNKILEYIRAGLHVVASNTKGQLELSHAKDLKIRYFKQSSTADLANVLHELAKTISRGLPAKKTFFDPTDFSELSWEHNSQTLLSNVTIALQGKQCSSTR